MDPSSNRIEPFPSMVGNFFMGDTWLGFLCSSGKVKKDIIDFFTEDQWGGENMYNTILFDVDGVLLSEKRCFDSTCLSVWELLYSPQALGLAGDRFDPEPDDETIERVRQEIFDQEQILHWLKANGVNSNWDMVSLLFGFQLQELLKEQMKKRPEWVTAVLKKPVDRKALQRIGDMIRDEEPAFTPRFGELRERLKDASADGGDLSGQVNRLAEEWSGVRTDVFTHGGPLWQLGREVYQEWYLGRERFESQEKKAAVHPEKKGFLEQEIPLVEPEAIGSMLKELAKHGITLGIGTGRPALETEVPLTALGLWDLFHTDRIATASDVRAAEKIYPDQAPLGKPHPFTYLKAYFGRGSSDTKSVAARLPLTGGDRILIVGDSVADLMAARRMGCRFAAVLTGPTGQEARGKFEELEADYILDDVTEVLPLIERLVAEETAETEEKVDEAN
ncbi:Phosphoglycolate phosphatase, HAD superfamily [Melghirimyces thermohalophilus]|uniref:Phosphoglycolate phosphatase, HAD superfamily n=2 Tax=Melghirimyces thermohalophilus TaxID=1236220 RepID=A0A1G6KLR4_9BACL|nr:Phosphoglycolate phosphatase, HAD superfamily [Melghirimyces thermohalophilus]